MSTTLVIVLIILAAVVVVGAAWWASGRSKNRDDLLDADRMRRASAGSHHPSESDTAIRHGGGFTTPGS